MQREVGETFRDDVVRGHFQRLGQTAGELDPQADRHRRQRRQLLQCDRQPCALTTAGWIPRAIVRSSSSDLASSRLACARRSLASESWSSWSSSRLSSSEVATKRCWGAVVQAPLEALALRTSRLHDARTRTAQLFEART